MSKTVFASTLIVLLLTGCWDQKNIQDVNYLTSIGFDYADNQYVVYVQMLDFNSVAKMESGKPSEPVPIWVGHGHGETAIAAITDLYRTSQMRFFYGQINSIVFSEQMLEKGIEDVSQLLNRYYEMRYTPWVFGTSKPIDKIFAVTPFFNLSPLMSLLHQPQESYKQESFIPPLTSRELAADLNEPGKTVLLPSLSVTNHNWNKDESSHSVLALHGAFILQGKNYLGWMDDNQIPGLRWMEPDTRRSPVTIRDDGKNQAVIYLESPKVKITPQMNGREVRYAIDVKLSGDISEVLQPLSESLLEEKAAQQVKKEIRDTFEKGLEMNADLLQLEHILYRKNVKLWKALREDKTFELSSSSLSEINVSVKLDSAGKQKYLENP